ncbi:pleckstrin homology domain-containing family A member 7 isoform X5 [Amphiprion ocellaris]|uniref:PH domain-containing protein n=1 Tax=Amphiprion ocellaris TaxID=80972 RepID=A0AAQ5Y6M9_AMPOC|nr:pleckstrin homology domain-containing family A member 7 isoform X5 [Amphiprion ocellaris]
MELKAASRRAQLVRMDDQDRVSQASSVATISYFPVVKESDGKVQTFGKRCQAAKRDPNCAVVIRGWLNKKDSSGLKLWKRRWFVLSNYCLFYYKDSREESVLGSIPLPSYKILFCTPRECKNRKFTFKVVHQGMRSYFFSADTQEDMLGWVRALSQSAAMEPDSTMSRRCSSYQDFTAIGGSTESVDFPKSPSDEEGPSRKHRHVSRTLSEPSQLSGGRMGRSQSEQRERRGGRHRNTSPSNRSPSPPDLSRRRAYGPNREEDSLPGQDTPPQTDMMGTGSLPSRGQLGSRPHTPVGRVDIRPHDDPLMGPQTLYYAPASPKLEFNSTPTTPVTERWQNLSKPAPTYGSVHHIPSGRRPLGKPPKPDPREMPPIRPLESDADAVLTRLCGCDKLLQSLSVELAQLQMDKDSVQCALEVSRLQLEEWKSQGPRAHEEVLTQKVLLQEELVTIRARMCDVSMEMERVWCQYERMESELSVIRSHLQHICNFGMPQEQSQAQRELWMMEDILAGLKVNRDHFRFLLGLQRHHMFQSAAPHPGSPGSPTERLQSGLPMDMEQEPPVRPPLPQELQETHQSHQGHGWTESPYEGIYSHTVDPVHRKGNSQPDLLNVKAHRDASESQPGSKWIPPDTTNQSTKKMKMKMSEEEQIERMKRNQERMSNRKKPPIPAPNSQSQSSETKEEAPFPLRVTRVVTAVLPSSLVARRVSVEDPPAELDTPLPEQIPPEMQQKLAEQNKKLLNKPPRRLLLDSPDQTRASVEMHQDQLVKKTSRTQHQGASRIPKRESRSEVSRAGSTETSSNQDQEGLGNGSESSSVRAEERSSVLLTPDMDPDPCLTPEQREAKLRRVERIRERVIRSAVRESSTTHNQLPIRGQGKDVHQEPPDTARKQRMKAGHNSHNSSGSSENNFRSSAELQLSSTTSQDHDEEQQHVKKSKTQGKFGNKTQHSGRAGVAKAKIKRPDSPYHISSMIVYQKDGGKGFIGCKDDEQKQVEEHIDDDNESDFKSSDVRAKWFLSTNQWQGFMPLQIPGIETLCNEEMTDIDNQPACSDDNNDSNEMSSTVSESLEKMKENHSLFYKIACDISISDSDITKNDGNTCAPTSTKPDEEETLLITESVPAEETGKGGTSSDKESKDTSQHLTSEDNEISQTADNKHQDSTVENQDKEVRMISGNPLEEGRVNEKTTAKESEDNSGQELKLKVTETINEAPVQYTDSDQAVDECTKMSEDKKEDQESAKVLKKCRSLSENNNQIVQEHGDKHAASLSSSSFEGGSVIRSASFGKARVTVLRTSL